MSEILVVNIAGPNGLPAANPANLSRASFVAADDDTGTTVAPTFGEVADALGDIKARGHVVGTGKIDADIAFAIQPGVVTLAMQASMATGRLLGRSAAGTGAPETVTVGSGLTLAGGVLSAAAPAAADPSTTALTRRFMHGF